MFTLKIETDNAAFAEYPGKEIARILREIASAVETVGGAPSTYPLKDINGNTVGVLNWQ